MSPTIRTSPEADLRLAGDALRAWRASPARFVREVFHATPDGWQDEALEAFPTTSRLALKACAGPGKSTLEAWLGWNFLGTRPFPKIAATSITWPNLRDNLWAEMAKWQRKSAWLTDHFTWTQNKIFANDHPEEWWMSARNWSRSADPEQQGNTLSGLHADYAMAILDECGGMPVPVLTSGEPVLSVGKEGHLLLGGNPTHLNGALHEVCIKQRPEWQIIEITADPDDPKRAPRVSMEWARAQIKLYGIDSAYVRAKVLGKFPLQATDALIGLNHFEDAFGRIAAPDGSALERGFKSLGIDVGRSLGSDPSVVASRDGCFLDAIVKWWSKDTYETSERVAATAREYAAHEIRVDDIGVGGGVTDTLKRLDTGGARVIGVNVGEASHRRGQDGQELYENQKAELNMSMREEWFQPGIISIDTSLKDSPIVGQATDMRYGYGRGGRVFKIESKDEYRKRHGGESPDEWDAVVLAFAPRGLGRAISGLAA